ncbi:YncE family protein [Streptomyces sp. SID1121]|uniref:YncE family protein n=1 Tax=Streptomyces sp. SID1121 TaxID=3425888 RepID=UPI0040574817
MRTRTLAAATSLAVLFSSAALVAATAAPAAADSTKTLSLKSAGDVLVDGLHQRVYVSDPTGGKLVVTDYAGTVQKTVTGLPGVDGLALSADSGQVYAAVAASNRIVSVDTATYTKAAEYTLGDAKNPRSLAVAGGKLWFGYGPDSSGNLGSLDLSGAEPVVALDQDGDMSSYLPPLLGSDPAAPGLLAVGERGQSTIALYDVTSGSAVLRVLDGNPGNEGSNLRDLDISPDGTEVVTAAGYPYYNPAYSTTDLHELRRYPSGDYGSSVAIGPKGAVASGTSSWYGPDLHLYEQGSTTPIREYEYGNTGNSSGGDTQVDGALAWTPDGSRVFAVSENSNGVFSLRSYTDPTKYVPKLTVAAPAKATRAKKLTVTGKLTSAKALPAGTALTVTRTDIDSPKGKVLPGVKTTANGSFAFADTPPAGGKVKYTVGYAGDATHAKVSASDTVEVSRTATSLTLNNNGKLYSYGADVSFTAHLGKTYKSRTVEIYADPFGADKPKRLVKTGKVNSKGNLSVTVDMTRDTTLTAVFAGDARSASKSVKSTGFAKVKISTAVSKHYRTGTIGSTKYYWFRETSDPLLTTTMSYYQGRHQRFELQVYSGGTWYSAGDPEYFALGGNGKSAVKLGGPGKGGAGIRARVRSAYINGSSGDSVNSSTYGAWQYLYFTK